jgi:hypothetical protein
MNEVEFAFGLDFGTSKTSMSRARCLTSDATMQDVLLTTFGDKRIATCLLLEQKDQKVKAYGTAAEYDYLNMDVKERKRYEFYANFKPQLHRGSQDANLAELFLSEVTRAEPVAEQLRSYGDSAATVVGCPAGWDEKAKKQLVEILERVGLPSPRCVPEPVGAFFYHLVSAVKAEDLCKDILVIDWGAGTCDFSVMHGGRVSPDRSWGSNIYGGRLFDDLFYQWVLESFSDDDRFIKDAKAIQSDPVADGILRLRRSREIKEKYSHWMKAADGVFRSDLIEVDPYILGKLQIKTFGEFEAKARNYKPTPFMVKELEKLKKEALTTDLEYLEKLCGGEKVDLIAWSEYLLDWGSRECGANKAGVVILTGGSSSWPWFQKLVRQSKLFDEDTNLYVDEVDPELSISRGLSRAYALGSYANSIREKLIDRQEEIFKKFQEQFLNPQLEQLGHRIAEQYMRDCYFVDFLPTVVAFRANQVAEKAAKEQLINSFRKWFDRNGLQMVSEEIEYINTHTGFALQEAAKECGVDFGGMLGLAIKAYSPVESYEAAQILRQAEIGRETIEEIIEQTVMSFGDWVAFILLSPIWTVLLSIFGVGLIVFEGGKWVWRLMTESESERSVREHKEQQEAEKAKEEEEHRVRSTVEEELKSTIAKALTTSPSLAQWASYDGYLCRSIKEMLFQVSLTSGFLNN